MRLMINPPTVSPSNRDWASMRPISTSRAFEGDTLSHRLANPARSYFSIHLLLRLIVTAILQPLLIRCFSSTDCRISQKRCFFVRQHFRDANRQILNLRIETSMLVDPQCPFRNLTKIAADLEFFELRTRSSGPEQRSLDGFKRIIYPLDICFLDMSSCP